MKTKISFKAILSVLLLNAFVLPQFIFAQQADVNARIREEGTKNSQVMKTAQMLTDVYGPRLTGTPMLKSAGEWAIKQMTEWGLENGALEPWDWGHDGWVNERAVGYITSPVQDSLVFEVLAWTPSTKGVVKGQAVLLNLPQRPTQEELTAYFNSVKPRVKGNVIFVGDARNVPFIEEPPAKRISDEDAKKRFDPNAERPAFPGRPGGIPGIPNEARLSPQQIAEQLNRFLIDNKAGVRVNDAGREHGQIRAFANYTFDVKEAVPTVVMRNEDYGRITRLVSGGKSVGLEFDIRNRTYPEGKTAYNTVAEIVGTDKKDEVIIIGGHLDSWHSATGATDNATGCSVMMEAARIIKALGLKPRRTIRVALWSGEEQGLHGSQAYVKKHFGSAEAPTENWAKFGGYFNHDTGTGKIRGFTVFGPPSTADALRKIVEPFSDLGVAGVMPTSGRGIGGSDHTSFNNAGLPGIGTALDPIEYGSHTWHTNLDTYERLIEADLQQGAIVIAAAAYELAMRDELLPRFSAAEMPKPPAPRQR